MIETVVREGCIGETVAALEAREALARASDPAVRAVLARIARDEARHAELAWRTVAWALSIGDERVRAAVAAAFRDAERALPAAEPALDLAAYGRLSGSALRAVLVR